MKTDRLLMTLFLIFSLNNCGLSSFNSSADNISNRSNIEFSESIKIFFFQSTGFTIASIDSEDQVLIDQLIQAFEADLDGDNLETYSTQPYQFSIQLLSGSEGNHFLSTEDLSSINPERQPAQAVVLDSQQNHTILKGEFENGQFFSAQTPAIVSNNKTYILTLNQNSEVQAFQGKLLAGTDGNHLTTPEISQPIQSQSPNINTLKNIPLSISQINKNRQMINQLRDVQYDLGEGQHLQLTRRHMKFMFGPPPPPKPHIKKFFKKSGFRPPPPGHRGKGFDPEEDRQKLNKRRGILNNFIKRRRPQRRMSATANHTQDPFAKERGKKNGQ